MFRVTRGEPTEGAARGGAEVAVDYYAMSCAAAQIRADAPDGAPALSAVCAGRANQPNVAYARAGAPAFYAARSVHLRGKIHDVAGLEHDGELVIEHTAVGAGNSRLFACFPMRLGAPAAGARRDSAAVLVRAADPAAAEAGEAPPEVCLNDSLPADPRLIVYESVDSRGMPCAVLVFLDEIATRVDLSRFSRDVRGLFDAVPRGAPDVAAGRRADGGAAVEGFTVDDNSKVIKSDGFDNDIFTCEYLPVSTDTVQVFQIPIDTQVVADTAHQEMTSMALYFVLSITFAAMVFFAAPVMYESSLATHFRTPIPEALLFLNGMFMTRDLTWTDLILVGALAVLAVGLTGAGVSSGRNPLKAAGLVLLVVLVVGIAGIHISAKMGWRKSPSSDDAEAHMWAGPS